MVLGWFKGDLLTLPLGLRRDVAGDFLRQTLTVRDDDDASCACSREVCFYVESEAKFRISFSKLSKAGLVKEEWKA